jgi:3-phosphoshikimate 1-carboxyvinyltransferase
LIGALAPGQTWITGGNDGADARAALRIVRDLGTSVRSGGTGTWLLKGGMLRESERILDARNSGTALRLSMGLLAAQPFLSILTGDASLRKRPVGRVVEPLRLLGATISARQEDRLPPVAIQGGPLRGASVRTPVASAQVKSAVLLAAIQADGSSTVEEAEPTRDHTERMLPRFGAEVARESGRVRVRGPARLQGTEVRVPGDLSAAAFLIAGAVLAPRSDLTIRNVGVNPTRRAFLDLLERAGATLELGDERMLDGEPVADLRVRSGALRPFQLGTKESGAMIDELPLVAVLAAFAEGESAIHGAGELRVKESDRIDAVTRGLRAIGADVEEHPDGWSIRGRGRVRGGVVDAAGDHRIAMAFLIAGLKAKNGVTVTGAEAAAVSDPGFVARLRAVRR